MIGDATRKKQEKNREDNRYLITIFRMGNAADNSSPLIFLAAGKKLESKALKKLDRKGHPPGYTVILTPSAYMTDVAWIQLVNIFAREFARCL